ncbi:MAG: sulfotransferase [Nocardioides sp.]
MTATTVVYLAGFGRSGSTLVERLLGAAPGWANVGELVELSRTVARADERCGCGLPFSRCPVWTGVGEAAFGGWGEDVLDLLTTAQRRAARQRHLPRLVASPGHPSGASAALRAAYSRVYRAIARVTDARVVVDASKGPALGQALAGAPGVDLRVLNVVRDPRAVAWSWSRRVDRPHATSGPAEMWRIPARRAGAQWSALQLEVEAMGRLGGVRAARVRYEDLVADPVATLVAATAELGLPLAPADLPPVVDDRVDLAPSHGLAGNPGRFRSGPVALRVDDAWTTEMPARDRAVVTALTLPLLAAYGYPVVSRPSTGPVRGPVAGPVPVDRLETRSTR